MPTKINTARWIHVFSITGIFLFINLLSILIIILPKANSILWLSDGIVDHISDSMAIMLLGLFGAILISIAFIIKKINNQLINITFVASIVSCLIAFFGSFYTDVYFLFRLAEHNNDAAFFATGIMVYIEQNMLYYSILTILIAGLVFLYHYSFKIQFNQSNDKIIQAIFVSGAIAIPVMLLIPLSLINIHLIQYFQAYYPLHPIILLIVNIVYSILTLVLFLIAFKIRKKTKEQLTFLIKFTNFIGGFCGFILFFEISSLIAPYFMLKKMHQLLSKNVLYYSGIDLKANAVALIILFIFTLILLVCRRYVKKLQFDDLYQEDNAGTEHGGAKWASTEDLTAYGYYKKEHQIYSGLDEKGNKLFLPLKNRTVVAPPGAGKTSTVAIPFLLQYDGPVFAMDLKGELWAVAARFRYEVLKRQQYAIDPFNVLQKPAIQYKSDFTKKPEELLQKLYVNPFMEIPEDPKLRQRVLKSLAKSFIVRDTEGGNSEHFYKRCECFVSGAIDYILKTRPREEQNFKSLLEMTQGSVESFNMLLTNMLAYGDESAYGASEILKAGVEERGSILTTVSGQLEWLLEINMQELLCNSEHNFSLVEFIEGKCDIYLILPSYAVESHGRLISMMLALVGETINLNDDNLCGQEYVFLMDEIAQLGKLKLIERIIEVYRTYDAVLWSIFQSYKQIEQFNKSDLFKDPGQGGVLQFFKTKNEETMAWIQKVFGKRTILQKTLSTNKGNQNQKNQIFGGSVSSGEGESVNSGGVDLVQFDEIREMPKDEQWFLVDDRPIKSKKVPYYEDPYFAGRWDINPFEKLNRPFVRKINELFGKKSEGTCANTDLTESVLAQTKCPTEDDNTNGNDIDIDFATLADNRIKN